MWLQLLRPKGRSLSSEVEAVVMATYDDGAAGAAPPRAHCCGGCDGMDGSCDPREGSDGGAVGAASPTVEATRGWSASRETAAAALLARAGWSSKEGRLLAGEQWRRWSLAGMQRLRWGWPKAGEAGALSTRWASMGRGCGCGGYGATRRGGCWLGSGGGGGQAAEKQRQRARRIGGWEACGGRCTVAGSAGGSATKERGGVEVAEKQRRR
ncbi:uncharacterized protein LOC135616353 [Musa acuminata AAA Group]|uniref:uncharacterized protein LOC135616353 n=1 Tax=Musa acuminata AAA Group TaxID=214697 RepID=UPI0031E3DCE3